MLFKSHCNAKWSLCGAMIHYFKRSLIECMINWFICYWVHEQWNLILVTIKNLKAKFRSCYICIIDHKHEFSNSEQWLGHKKYYAKIHIKICGCTFFPTVGNLNFITKKQLHYKVVWVTGKPKAIDVHKTNTPMHPGLRVLAQSVWQNPVLS